MPIRVPFIKSFYFPKCGIPTKKDHHCEKCKSKPPMYRMMRSWAVFDTPVQNEPHTGKKRLKERGYNQVGLVAQPLAYDIGVQYAPNALWKSRETRSQVGLSIDQRKENVHKAYQANPEVVKRKSILLMDDVATTGSTIQSCTETLLSAGAQ